jgi:hypothetical protein
MSGKVFLLGAALTAVSVTAHGQPPLPPPFFAPFPGGVEPPMRVMSDTLQYCHQLAGEVNREMVQRVRVPVGVEMLSSEGQRLCAMGHLRPGIARLRMAMRRLEDRR